MDVRTDRKSATNRQRKRERVRDKQTKREQERQTKRVRGRERGRDKQKKVEHGQTEREKNLVFTLKETILTDHQIHINR